MFVERAIGGLKRSMPALAAALRSEPGRVILKDPFDAFPFVFFNLLLAILVALQGPLIVMSQNRQTLKDRAQAETDFKVNLKNELNIETILRELGEFRSETDRRLDDLESRKKSASVRDLDPRS